MRNFFVAVNAIRTKEILRVLFETLHSRGNFKQIHRLPKDIGGYVKRERSRHVRFRREYQICLIIRTNIELFGKEGILVIARKLPDVTIELVVEISIRQQTLNFDSSRRGGIVEICQVTPYERTD